MASGPELMLNSLVRWLGIKPEELFGAITDIHDRIISFDERLSALEANIDAICKHLDVEVRHAKQPPNKTVPVRIEGSVS